MAQNQDNVLTLNNKPNVQIENNENPLIGSDIRFNNQSQRLLYQNKILMDFKQ